MSLNNITVSLTDHNNRYHSVSIATDNEISLHGAAYRALDIIRQLINNDNLS